MSYGTYLTTTITFNRETFDHKWQVQDALNKVNESVADARRMIHEMVVMTDPAKMMSPDELENATPYEWLAARTRDLLDEIENLSAEGYRLQLLLDDWSFCHTPDGRPIRPPYSSDEVSFLEGDYLKGGVSMEELNKLKEQKDDK